MTYRIVEGIAGVWHYHLTDDPKRSSRALCGAATMYTAAPLNSWGFRPAHMPSSYCTECERLSGVSPKQAEA